MTNDLTRQKKSPRVKPLHPPTKLDIAPPELVKAILDHATSARERLSK